MADSSSSFIHPDRMLRSLGLRAGETLVHMGCGAGFYVVPAAQIVGKAGKVYGIDVLPDMLAETESRARRSGVQDVIKTIRANLEKEQGSTLPNAVADWVLVANVLHQSDPVKLLTEAKRITKPTGKIVVIEWDVVATPLGPPASARISQGEVKGAIVAVGGNVVQEFKPSPYHYGLLVTP